ncbi:MAG: non-canonical purine NTP diphosphatase [Bacteroidota bacterium]
MLMKLIFATNNNHKLKEIQHLLKNNISLLSLSDIGFNEELFETGNSLEENAIQKAQYIYKKYKIDCFADDTGLEIDALEGKPGILSARYAGEKKSAEDNIKKVLFEMNKKKNRNCKFITVISLIIGNKTYLFEGKIKGSILYTPRGNNGFGYDSIFQPKGFTKSFAEMSLEEKNTISHRAIVIKKLAEFLNRNTDFYSVPNL